MNLKKNIFSFAVLMFAMMACEGDFLDKSPIDQVSTTDFWNTSKDLEIYVNQFYTLIYEGDGERNNIYTFDSNSDHMVKTSPDPRLASLLVVPPTGGWDYEPIRGLNYFLENYQKVQDSSPEDYMQFVGEVRFFRAYHYFNMVKTYGDVPWVGQTLLPGSEELYNLRAPRNVVVDSIIADLDIAIEMMGSGPNMGGTRLNKEVAQLFKARVAMYEGSWEKYHSGSPFGVSNSDGTKYLELAVEAASDVINSGTYSLYTQGNPALDYWELFGMVDYSNNSEVMFWKKYDFELNMTQRYQRKLATDGGGGGITKSLVKSYLCIDGLPISKSPLYLGDDNLTAEVTNRDLRLQQTIFTRGFPQRIEANGDTVFFDRPLIDLPGESLNTTGYQLLKSSNPTYEMWETPGNSTVGTPLFRFAEALLLFAEAKAELGTITQEDLDISINILRDRVGMAHLELNNIVTDPDWDFPELSPIINEVRRERGVEFAVEGHRWDDIARWSAADELVIDKRFVGSKFNSTDYPELDSNDFKMTNGYFDFLKDQLPSGYQFDPDKDYLMPIPTQELVLNPNLAQNPGW